VLEVILPADFATVELE